MHPSCAVNSNAPRPFTWIYPLLCLSALWPWIQPLNPGPSVSAVPLLVSWGCISVLLLSGWRSKTPRAVASGGWGLAAAALGGLALGSMVLGAGPEGVGLLASLAVVCACVFRFAGADEQEIDALVVAWLWAGMISAVFGLLQFTGWADAFSPWISHNTPGEAYGNLRQRNLYATHLNIALCALIGLAVRTPHRLPPLAAAACAVLLSMGTVFSHSRTGLFELLLIAAAAFAWGLHRHRAVRWTLVGALAGYAAISLGLAWLTPTGDQGIVARFTDTSSPCMSRVALWRNVVELIAQRPWLGWGWGELDYAHMMHPYAGERFCAILDNAHNLPLHLAVELGLPCAAGVCLVILGLIWRLRPWVERHPGRQLAWLVLGVIGLHSLLEYPLWYGPFQLAAGIGLALLWGTRTPASAPATGYRYPAYINGVLGLLLAGGTAYAGWDYHLMRQIYLDPPQRAAAYRDDPMLALHQTHLFREHALFAELTLTPVEASNAAWVYDTASELLHFSPEPRVLERVIESATLQGHDQVALLYLARFMAVYPREHSQWQEHQRLGLQPDAH